MSQTLLSILIPITPDRREVSKALYDSIYFQTGINTYFLLERAEEIRRGKNVDNSIEVIEYMDNRELTIGEKRERLYKLANGLYSWQIDSDDNMVNYAVELILESTKQNPDCVTFRENCMMNGEYYSSNHSLKYEDWADNFDGFDFVRTPFYKDVIKTEIARSVPFEHIRYGEDHAWARALKPHLQTEVHIDEEIYYYIHNSKPEDHNERYGLS